MVLFRADGNPQIGTGHIMRCLSLADAFQKQGTVCVFVLAETYMQSLIQKRGYDCIVRNTQYDHMEEELPAFMSLLDDMRPSCVVLDSYFVTPDYMRLVKAKVPLVYIDDLNLFDYPADIVVNYNLYGSKTNYPANKTYLLGPQYAPLRKQFQRLGKRTVRERAEHILFSTGGTDPYHVAWGCTAYLREHPPASGVICHILLGAMNQDAGQIRNLTAEMPYIVLHQQVTDICALMQQCDAAISAAGTTLYELCACGVPTVTYIFADNQIEVARAFEDAGLMLGAGDIRSNAQFVEHIFSKLDELNALDLRRETVRRMQFLVDGNGALRLADCLREFLSR